MSKNYNRKIAQMPEPMGSDSYEKFLDYHKKNPNRCPQCGKEMGFSNVSNPSNPTIYNCDQCGHTFNPDNEKFTPKKAQSMGMGSDPNPMIPNSSPENPPILPMTTPTGEESFEEDDENLCPHCHEGHLSDWEEEEQDAYSHSRGHYTKPTGREVRYCDSCNYEQDREKYNRKTDSDYQYETRRDKNMMDGFASSYFNIKKIAQSLPSSSMPNQPIENQPMDEGITGDIGGFEDDNFGISEKPSKEYFASIGVRIKVVPQQNPQQEVDLARQALEAIREQIHSGVDEDQYEAWLSGMDEEPKPKNQIM